MNNTELVWNKFLCILFIFPLLLCYQGQGQITGSKANASSISIINTKDTTEISGDVDSKERKYLQAKIIRIMDGDTVEILYGELPIKLRLEHIDCPEKRGKQPFGNRAKIALSDLCFGQMVTVSSDGKFDRNGRLIGVIFNKDSLNVNKEMVRMGMAWHFKKYSDDMSYDQLEKEARKTRVGLWSDPNPIAPWDYR